MTATDGDMASKGPADGPARLATSRTRPDEADK